jgi:hypothetical protein
MNTRKSVSAKITYTALEQLLKLPEEHKIVAVLGKMGEYYKRFQVVIEGPSLPEVVEGETIPHAVLIYREGEEFTEIRWE